MGCVTRAGVPMVDSESRKAPAAIDDLAGGVAHRVERVVAAGLGAGGEREDHLAHLPSARRPASRPAWR